MNSQLDIQSATWFFNVKDIITDIIIIVAASTGHISGFLLCVVTARRNIICRSTTAKVITPSIILKLVNWTCRLHVFALNLHSNYLLNVSQICIAELKLIWREGKRRLIIPQIKQIMKFAYGWNRAVVADEKTDILRGIIKMYTYCVFWYIYIYIYIYTFIYIYYIYIYIYIYIYMCVCVCVSVCHEWTINIQLCHGII